MSGDQYEEDEDDEEDYNEPITTLSPHPHRHHHGESFNTVNDTNFLTPSEVQYHLPSTSLLIDYEEDLVSTPVFIPERPTERMEIEPTKVLKSDYFSLTATTIPSLVQESIGKSTFQKVCFSLYYFYCFLYIITQTEVFSKQKHLFLTFIF